MIWLTIAPADERAKFTTLRANMVSSPSMVVAAPTLVHDRLLLAATIALISPGWL
jgi:hypothetical protein